MDFRADLCTEESLLAYLVVRGTKEEPLLIFKDGHPFSRQGLVTALRGVLQAMGVDQSKYCGLWSQLSITYLIVKH